MDRAIMEGLRNETKQWFGMDVPDTVWDEVLKQHPDFRKTVEAYRSLKHGLDTADREEMIDCLTETLGVAGSWPINGDDDATKTSFYTDLRTKAAAHGVVFT